MFLIDTVILVTGFMLLLGIASSKFSARFGVPVLVLFLALGMLAGSEGIGGIEFENFQLAHAIGTVALAVILFDGGLSTSLDSIRTAWRPASLLATLGVLVTALITGAAASWIMGITLMQGLLLGSIVASTDAAAVFAALRSGGIALPRRIKSTLEVESASNDPMAIFMTVGCIEVMAGDANLGAGLAGLFIEQMLYGALIGLAVGMIAVRIINQINLSAAGLYPVLASAMCLLAFGLAAWIGGSGFLAVYVLGVMLGNSQVVFKRGILMFHDAGAWLSQIVMFVVLGLLCFPSQLLQAGGEGIAVTAVMMFLARPVAVLLSTAPFGFNWRELTLFSWVGLKGAVPITLATFPLLFEVPGASKMFNVVFFVVLFSALVQGWTLPLAARRLGLQLPLQPPPPVTLELSSLRNVEGDIVDYTVAADSRASGKLVKDLALPEGVVIAIIAREDKIIPPQGSTRVEAGDHVILVLSPGTRPLVNQVFAASADDRDELPQSLEFPLRGSVKVAELEEFYGIRLNADANATLSDAIHHRSPRQPVAVDDVVRYGAISLHVREVGPGGVITQVGMVILPESQWEPVAAAEVKPEQSGGSEEMAEPATNARIEVSDGESARGESAPPA